MKSCFCFRKCVKCNEFYEIKPEYEAKGLLIFKEDVSTQEFKYKDKGKNKHFKIESRD